MTYYFSFSDTLFFFFCLRADARPQADWIADQRPSWFSLPQQEDLGKNSQVKPPFPSSLALFFTLQTLYTSPTSLLFLSQDAVLPPAFKNTRGEAVKPTDATKGFTGPELQEITLISDGQHRETYKSDSALKGKESALEWSRCLAWALCLLLGLSSLLLAAVLGTRWGTCERHWFQRLQHQRQLEVFSVLQIQRWRGPAVGALSFLLAGVLRLPHPASRGIFIYLFIY